jgi:hemerythrin
MLTWDTDGTIRRMGKSAQEISLSKVECIVSPLPQQLLIGIPSIDEEHQSLLEQLDDLFQSPNDNPQSAQFSEDLSRLSSNLIDHFTNEERVMRSIGISSDELARHMDAHSAIIEQITQLSFDLMNRRQIDRGDVVARMKDWILGHLTEHDLDLRNYPPPA